MININLEKALLILKDNRQSPQWLYENWWSRPVGNDVVLKSGHVKYFEEFITRELFLDGRNSIQSSGTDLVQLEAGDYVRGGGSYCLVKRRINWEEDGWLWRNGERPQPYPKNTKTLRIYIPSTIEGPLEIFNHVACSFDSQAIPFVMKARKFDGIFTDHFVIWMNENFLREALECLKSLVANQEFSIQPPPGTIHHWGLGFAESPSSGESLGWQICQAIWAATQLGWQEEGEKVFAKFGIIPEAPWLLSEYENHKWTDVL